MFIQINRLQHVGIPVQNLEISEAFYQKLGFKNVMAASFMHNEAEGKVAMMKNGEIIIELYQMPTAELDAISNRKDGRIDHIAFDVDDIHQTFDILKKANFDIIEEAPITLRFWKKGCSYFNISGPDGERLEFNQIL